MSKFLTSAGWKTVLKDNKGKFADNGLQKALEKYESRKPDDFKNRLADLKSVFMLALSLSNAVKKLNLPAVMDYLAKMGGDSVKTQEKLTAEMKAAAVSTQEKTMLRNMVIQSATNVATSAKLNASIFGQQVHRACTALEQYAKPKIDEMEGGISAADLLGPLVSIAGGQIVGALMAGVADELAKKVVEQMAKKAEDAMMSKAKSIGSGSKDLEKALQALVMGAHDAATAMETVVQKLVITQCDKVTAEVNAGKTLSPQLTEFIEPFINAQASGMDKLIEQRFGVPSPAKSKSTQAKIYQKLVESFEVTHIKATTASGEKMEWVVKGVPQSVKQGAEARAKQAAQQREKEMSSAERSK